LLAIDQERYRLEIISKTGAVVVAVAGEPGGAIKIDPATGKKSFYKDNLVFLTENLSVPASFLRSMITGAAPPFEGIKSTSIVDGLQLVKTVNPRIDFYYSNRLKKLTYHLAHGGRFDLALGPMADGPVTPFVSSAKLSYGKLTITVRWEEVAQAIGFADRFFQFDEPL